MEVMVAHLKSLNFTTVPKAQAANPVLVRRSKLIVQLENQKALAKDPTFATHCDPHSQGY